MTPPAPSAKRPLAEMRRILYWIYFGRMTVALGVYGAALLTGRDWWFAPPGGTGFSASALAFWALLGTIAVTVWGYWHSHLRHGDPHLPFLYVQAAFDVLLLTGVVLLAGGSESVLPPLLYIALVSGYAVITPLASGLLVAGATALAYLLVIALAYPEQLGLAVLLQTAIFTTVALVSGAIGGRLRQIDRELSNLERELRRVRLGTADILRTLDAAVLTLDSEGSAVYLNPAAADLLDLDPEEWVGRSLLAVLEAKAPGVAEAVRETFASETPVRGREVELETEGDGVRPFSVSTSLLRREGEPTLATIALQDLQLARQLEELHLRAGRLAAVAELSASLAHEIKNPLASIRSAVEQIADPSADAEDRATLGQLVVRESDRLTRLLSEFNDFARVNVAERRPIDLERIVREAIEMVAQRPEAEGRAEFHVDIADGLDDLWGDPDLVHRTLTNLVLNAVQVSDPSGSVTVHILADALSPEFTPARISSGMPVRIRVIDDGPGIAPEDIGRIFDPFYTRRQGGSGMGLAIAHRAIQAHGGALLVSSTPGQGATFAVVLPRRQPKSRDRFAQAGGTVELESLVEREAALGRARSGARAAALDDAADRVG